MSVSLSFAAATLAMGVPVPVDPAVLATLPTRQATLSAHGKIERCEGPLLADYLAALGAPKGEHIRGAALAQGLLVTARDGYRVLFSLGELDAALGASPAVLALRCDGKPLTEETGPVRLVIAGETRAARSVRQVSTLELVQVAPSAK